jgi:hypothetical protein
MSPRLPVKLCAVMAASLAIVLLGGCKTDKVTTSDGRPMPPPPRESPPVPAGARASRMLFLMGPKPTDSNGNGYPDRMEATIVLFASPHPTPMWEDGTFVFLLHPASRDGTPRGQPLREWRFGGEQLAKARAVSELFGKQYSFTLSLCDQGTDVYPLLAADVTCSFEPADGSPAIASEGVRTIQIGRGAAPPLTRGAANE